MCSTISTFCMETIHGSGGSTDEYSDKGAERGAMRIRSVKPSFWPHRMHRRISEPAALLALALISWSDDEGRFEADPIQIEKQLFPYRPLSIPIPTALQELKGVDWCVLYSAKVNGEALDIGQVLNFRKHQWIQKARGSSYPPPPRNVLPDGYCTATIRLSDGYELVDSEATSSKKVRLPDYMDGKEGRKDRKDRRHTQRVVEPSLEEVLGFGLENRLLESCCRKFFHDNKSRGGFRVLEDWRSALLGYAISWTEVEKSAAALGPGNGAPPTDDPGWWTMPVYQLENDAMGLAQSSDGDLKKTAARMLDVLEARRRPTSVGTGEWPAKERKP